MEYQPMHQQFMLDELERINGYVNECIFENEDTGYKVLEVESDDGLQLMTVVGIMPDLQVGERIEARGRWKEHNTYGEQFEVSSFSRTLPQDKDAMERYLGSGAIKGIGAALAHRIVEKFGDNTFHIIEAEPERLAEVKGISSAKACEIGEQFAAQSAAREAMVFLQGFGLTPNMSMRIYKEFGMKTVSVLSQNPYILAERVQGIGFRRADEIARQMGIPEESPGRIRGAIRFALQNAAGEGHTYLPLDKLEDEVFNLIGISGIMVDNALTESVMEGQLVQKCELEEERVYLKSFYTAESGVARRLMELVETPQSIDEEKYRLRMQQIEKDQKIELSDEQREAVLAALKEGVLIITGGPGTGKTTIINVLLELLEQDDKTYVLAAPTGRAAKRMTEATGREAKTIHRLLEIQFGIADSGKQIFQRDEEHPLETDVVILDEVSMIDVTLMNHLLKAIAPGTKLILAGDKDQLPSVGAGNVLKDMIQSDAIAVKKLTRIYRQAAMSDIVVGAHMINQGQYPVFNQKDTDLFFMKRKVKEDVIRTMVEVILKRMPKFAGCLPVDDIQVLTPMKRGFLGVENLNPRLQEALNPKSSKKAELEYRDMVFREGDKVMQIKNNYSLTWKVLNRYGYPLEEGEGVFNGDVGRIKQINTKTRIVTVLFDDKRQVEYDYVALEELELAYAITIHKSQGTESPIVVIPLHSGPEILFSRNLLYTAVTRAKRYVIVIGDEAMVHKMVDNDRQAVRYSSLAPRLREIARIFEGV